MAYLNKKSKMGFVGGRGKLPVHIQTVEAVLSEEDDCVISKLLSIVACAADGLKVSSSSRISSDGKQDLYICVGLLLLNYSSIHICDKRTKTYTV